MYVCVIVLNLFAYLYLFTVGDADIYHHQPNKHK